MQLNSSMVLSESHILSVDCSAIVHNTDIGSVDFIKTSNINLFDFLSTRLGLFIVAHVKHIREFVQITQVTFFVTILVTEHAANLTILLFEEDTEILVSICSPNKFDFQLAIEGKSCRLPFTFKGYFLF